jgi:hypothetical protein
MGIKASDDLYQLIQAMSAAEKRAFKLLSERHARQSGNNYLLLFEAIAAQKAYDEAALRRQFAGMAFLNNLAEAKSYLYQSLLRSMRFSRGAESPETELREVLDHLELLHEKGLIEQAERQVKIGLDKARHLSLHAFSAEFLRWQRRLVKWRGGKNLLEELAQIGAAETEVLHHHAIETQLRDLMGRIQVILAQQADLVGPARQAVLQALFEHPALQHAPVASGFHALSAYYYSHAHYHRTQGQARETLEAWKSLVATYESHPQQIKRQPDQYANALASLIDTQLNNRPLHRIPPELDRLRQLKAREPHTAARIFFLELHLSFRFALVSGQLEEALQRVPDLEAGMAKHKKFLNAGLEMTMLYNLCSLYFLAERYPEAQRYINLTLNKPQQAMREDILDGLHILEMVARYVRGQVDVLEHLLRAHERRLRQRETIHPFGSMVIKFIARLLNAADATAARGLIVGMHGDLAALPQDTKPVAFDELNFWLRSRIEGKRVVQIMLDDAMDDPTEPTAGT